MALDEDDFIDLVPIGRAPLMAPNSALISRSLSARSRRRRRGVGDSEDDDDDDGNEYDFDDIDDDRGMMTPSRFPQDGGLPTPLLGGNHQSRPPKLNGLNYLNVITYLVNVFVSYGIGYAGLFGLLPTRWEIFKHYETLVTPAEYAVVIWAPILLFEAIFAAAQLFPHYRARPIIQQGTGFFFFYTCIIQTAWTLFFAFECFILAFVAVVAALLCLSSLLASQHYCNVAVVQGRNSHSHYYYNHASSGGGRYKSLSEYWLFRFPFYLHCGWMIMCSVVQFSILFRHYSGDLGLQLAADIVALGVMLPAATFFLTGQPSGPDLVIPLAIIWSYVSIALELRHPSETLLHLYGTDIISAFQVASYFFAGTVVIMLVPRVVIWMAQEFCTINVVDLMANDDDDGDDSHFYYRFSLYNRQSEGDAEDPAGDNGGEDEHKVDEGVTGALV